MKTWHRKGRIELLGARRLNGALVPGKSHAELRSEKREGWSSGVDIGHLVWSEEPTEFLPGIGRWFRVQE